MTRYMGRATLSDGERRTNVVVALEGDEVEVQMRTQDGVERSSGVQRDWHGRVTSEFDAASWSGTLATLTLPDGRTGGVTIEDEGLLRGSGEPPFEI
jgi:hypothetical protein